MMAAEGRRPRADRRKGGGATGRTRAEDEGLGAEGQGAKGRGPRSERQGLRAEGQGGEGPRGKLKGQGARAEGQGPWRQVTSQGREPRVHETGQPPPPPPQAIPSPVHQTPRRRHLPRQAPAATRKCACVCVCVCACVCARARARMCVYACPHTPLHGTAQYACVCVCDMHVVWY